MIVLVTGGSGSGKSAWAERAAAALPAQRRFYLATMRVYDPESERRVARHRAQRAGRGFETLERPVDIGGAAVAAGSLALLEDLPNLLANEMFGRGDPARILPGIRALAAKCAHLLIVTGEVFSDGGRYGAETLAYMRTLACLNREAAALADAAVEVVYSIPVPLKGELPCV